MLLRPSLVPGWEHTYVGVSNDGRRYVADYPDDDTADRAARRNVERHGHTVLDRTRQTDGRVRIAYQLNIPLNHPGDTPCPAL